jgi:hypothetical protein
MILNFETVFHTYSGYPLSGLVIDNNSLYYAHVVDIYDAIFLYTLTPISDDEAETLMRNAVQLRDLVERAIGTVEFNTASSEELWREVTEQTQINLPAPGVYLYSK